VLNTQSGLAKHYRIELYPLTIPKDFGVLQVPQIYKYFLAGSRSPKFILEEMKDVQNKFWTPRTV